MWGSILSAGLAGIGAYSQASVGKAEAQANTRVSKALAKSSNAVRDGANRFSAARGALQRYLQSASNNQTLAAGGESLEANLVNARRQDDKLAEASFEDQIRAAEQLGSQAAAAAFAGVGGEVADMVSTSTRLMQQRAALDAAESRDFALYDTARRAASIQQQTVRSLDTSILFDSLDYTVNVGREQAAPSVWGSTALAVGNSLLNTGFSVKGGATKNEWGTGSSYGNQDYGNFL